jgi:hypothetical protein
MTQRVVFSLSRRLPTLSHCKVLGKLEVTRRVSIQLRGSTAEARTLYNLSCCYIKISATAWELCEAKWLDVEWTRRGFAYRSCHRWPRYSRTLSDVYKLWHFVFIELHLAVWINLILNFFLTVLTSFSRPRLWYTEVFVHQCTFYEFTQRHYVICIDFTKMFKI